MVLATTFIFNKLFGKKISNIISIVTIILFMLVAGASPSVVRAGIMAIILIISNIFSKEPNTLSTISFTALAMLLFNPYIICDVGFILSFGGTIGIVLLYDKTYKLFENKFIFIKDHKIINFLVESLCVTLSAQIILFPIMCYFFNTLSLVSILTNLLVAPFVGVITILGLALYIISLIIFPIAKILSYVLITLITIVISISNICSNLPYASVLVPTPSIIIIFLYYLIIVKIFMNQSKLKSGYFTRLLNTLIIISLVTILIDFIPKNYYEVNFVDVGQGDCIHIKTPHNKNILIDGGGSESSNYDIGEKVLIPYILDNTNGIIDAIFITHFHEDHAEGVISLIDKLRVNKVYISAQSQKTELYSNLLRISKEKNIQIIEIKTGQEIIIDGATFKILYADNKIENDLNNNSLIIKLSIFDKSILFTGDAEEVEEKLLIDNYKSNKQILDCEILKVGHHGSKTSSSNELLSIVSPKLSIISCGVNNKFGHPNRTTIEKLESNNSKIYRTDENGEIMLKIFQKELKISTLIH